MLDPELKSGEMGKPRLFPEGLVRWSGHRDGGVRKPFQQNSGRPTGQQIETPLVRRLRDWARGLVAGKHVPRAILLVGGPGNGKTDAVEGCVAALDTELGAAGALVQKFAQEFMFRDGELPPRKVLIDLATCLKAVPAHLNVSLALVQDATVGDAAQGAKAEELLLDELVALLDPDRSDIYLCCVNRGILARAATFAQKNIARADAMALLSTITECVTSGPRSPRCWPLSKFKHIAVWPMDVESLVDPSVSDDCQSVAHQIFGVALDESKWSTHCGLNTRCPFCQNRKILSRKGALDSLIALLHYYELQSGKRWTFRDLFSLVPYLLVGDYSELEIKNKRFTPCEWAATQFRFSKEGRVGSTERDRAPYLLMSRLYHHRLFPRWPGFDRGDHRKAKRALLKTKNTDEGLAAAGALYRFTARAAQIASLASGDVPNRVRDSLGPGLDPALATGDDALFSRNAESISIADVESRFSLSVKHGKDLVGSQLETLERDVLDQLCMADESLVEDKFPRNRTRQASILQSTLRQFAARLSKRSLGTRHGVCRDVGPLRQYLDATRRPEALNGVRKELRILLHDSHNKFRAGLATTFGQPVAERSRDVSLLLSKMVAVKLVEIPGGEGRPTDSLPYVEIEGHYVALTFELFRALGEVGSGLHDASLPSEIYSLLDRVRSLVSGQVVRNKQVLKDGPMIVLGSSEDVIEYDGGRFHFSKGARA